MDASNVCAVLFGTGFVKRSPFPWPFSSTSAIPAGVNVVVSMGLSCAVPRPLQCLALVALLVA
eukprot:3784667-Amphidinium_carterae.1